MAETYEEIRDDIEQQRDDLAGNIQRLESTVKQSFDARGYFQERPLDIAIIALGAGLFLADMLRRSDDRRAPEYDEMNQTLGNIRVALMRVGKQQFGALAQSARAGMRR